jgi:hypothetical protein
MQTQTLDEELAIRRESIEYLNQTASRRDQPWALSRPSRRPAPSGLSTSDAAAQRVFDEGLEAMDRAVARRMAAEREDLERDFGWRR